MPLINWKVKLNLTLTKHCILATCSNDNDNVNSNNIIFTIKYTKLYVLVVTLSAKDNQKLSKPLGKGFERSVCWNEYKTKSKKIIHDKLVWIFSRITICRYYLPKGVTKKYNVIIKGKSFYDQPIHSDIKRYKELKKLATDQDENYTTGCLSDYDFIKNNYRLIAGDLKR